LAVGFIQAGEKSLQASQRAELPEIVEMGGVEPPSKQRTKQLSTRLFFLWLSAGGCRKTGHPRRIL